MEFTTNFAGLFLSVATGACPQLGDLAPTYARRRGARSGRGQPTLISTWFG
jgi:hypothetical protein